MNFSARLEAIKEDLNLEDHYDKQEAEGLIKEALKDEIQNWMDEHGIQGNIVVQLSFFDRPYWEDARLSINYVAIWNNSYSSGKYTGWLNKLTLSIERLAYKFKHPDGRQISWREWKPSVKHQARTDHDFIGEDLAYSFEGRMLNLMQEAFYVFESSWHGGRL